jgi:hypothetical protein
LPSGGLGACCTLNGRPQDGPVALAFVRAEASDRDRRLLCKGAEERHRILCRRLPQLSGISREETSSNAGILEILPSYSTQ